MAGLTIERQDRLIRRDWPFRTVLLGDSLALWRGFVTGLSAAYDVSILYVTRPLRDGYEYAHSWFPEVRVIAPEIRRRAEEPDTPIPHVYDESTAHRPMLCLFDPAENGWSPDQSIAATTIPLIADWLRFYEAWMATGVWTGGGRDHAAHVATPLHHAPPCPVAERRVTDAAGMTASRNTIATRVPALPTGAARWQLLDLRRLPSAHAEQGVTTPAMALAA